MQLLHVLLKRRRGDTPQRLQFNTVNTTASGWGGDGEENCLEEEDTPPSHRLQFNMVSTYELPSNQFYMPI